jgi:uncharacterized LabA/DUF88 family protein
MESTATLRAGRVAVFLDYHNIYKGAREAFFEDDDPHWRGQFRPMRLGLKLAGAGDDRRKLVSVSVYRGVPTPTRDDKGARAAQRQLHAWKQEALTRARVRPLNYRTNPPREKGVDVQLAIDVAAGAIRDEYDVAVVFTADTDLLPAIELVAELKGQGAVEVAAWVPQHGSVKRLRLPGRELWCHMLTRTDYEHVRDETNYSLHGRRR